MKDLKVSVIQLNVKVNAYQDNLDRAAKMIRKCAQEGATLVCLPEAFATSLNLPNVRELAQTTDGEICTFLRDMAKECGVYLIGGFIESEVGSIYSSSVCISPEGMILGKYQRRYIYALEKHFLTSGKKACLMDTKIGKIGLIMGYDINFPEACRDLFKEGVEIIVSPTQIPRVYYQSTRQLAVARATENNCYFILASSCGTNTIARLVYMGGSLAAHSSTGLEEYSPQYSQQKDIWESCEHDEGYFTVKLNMTKIRREIKHSSFFDDFMRQESAQKWRGKMRKVNVALIQSRWNADPEETFAQVYETAKKVLSENDIQILCLPEFFTGAPFYMPERGHVKGIIDETIPGPMTDKFGALAKEYGTYIMCGTIIEREGDKYYNTCAVIDDNGEIIAKARKIHRYASELNHLEAGDGQVLLDTKYGKIGICICSDFWIPEMPRILALRGAEIIYVPGGSLRQNIANTKPVIMANSALNVCYTLYCSIVGGMEGVRAGRNVSIQFEGHTSIAGPRGMINSLDNKEGVAIGELDMDEMRKLRKVDTSFKETLFWSLWGREPKRYGRLLEPYVEDRGNLKDMVVGYLNS